MSMQNRIETYLKESLSLTHLTVENESHNHGGAGTETHYKVTVVSDAFSGLGAVKRHQKIYALLAQALANGVHALALHTYTPAEWTEKNSQSPQSPSCMGGSQ
jgi:BolA protein